MRDQLAAEQRERRAWFGATLVFVLLIASITILTIRRRHRSRVRVPDTPAELLERADADR